MKSEDPWKEMKDAPTEGSLVGHLVLESRPHEVFRSRDQYGRRILFLVHDRACAVDTRLPEMAGLHIESRVREGDGRLALIVRLESGEDADIFTRFCEDIIETVSQAGSENAAVQAFVGRTWKWHALLKGARKKTLSRESQLGLIGELHTLTNIIAPLKGLGLAIEGWRGSEGAPKDFELSKLCVECKARGASSRDKVRISSEHQLADVSGHAVVLLVHTFASAGNSDISKVELHGVVSSLRASVSTERADLKDMLETKLEDYGYDEEHEYEISVVHQSTRAFLVGDDFPRIVPGTYPEGPVEISYDLPLSNIMKFEISATELNKRILSGEKEDA